MTHPELTMEQVEQIQDCAADMLDSKLRYEIRPDTLYDICTAALAHLRSQPAGYVSVPREPTPEMLARCAAAVWPRADARAMELARQALPKLSAIMDWLPERTFDIQANMATMVVGYKAMISASPPAGGVAMTIKDDGGFLP